MMNKEEAVLQVRDLLLRYGNGCECCRSRQPPPPPSRWKRTAVPAAVLSGLYAMYPLTFIPEKY